MNDETEFPAAISATTCSVADAHALYRRNFNEIAHYSRTIIWFPTPLVNDGCVSYILFANQRRRCMLACLTFGPKKKKKNNRQKESTHSLQRYQ